MTDAEKKTALPDTTLELATDIVTAYVSNNPVPAKSLPEVINAVHGALIKLKQEPGTGGAPNQKPAVPIRKSVTDDYIICLEDGKKLKILKRYLRTRYNMSPEEYREKWNLPPDYPMVAPSYTRRRSQFAKEIGLGKSGRGGRKKKK